MAIISIIPISQLPPRRAFRQTNPDVRLPKIKASGRFAQHHPDWVTPDTDWDVEMSEVDAAEADGGRDALGERRLGPPWVRTGWFNAERLLGGDLSDPVLKAARRNRLCGASRPAISTDWSSASISSAIS